MNARLQRRGAAGFTMVELLIAMVAGLAVVLSVVAMGRDATVNFHHEMRVAGAQMSQRLAAQRLRADVERTGFMATGNMLKDPQIAHCMRTTAAPCPTSDNVGAAPSYLDTTNETGLTTLMSVRIKVGGSIVGPEHANVATYSALNVAPLALNPDSVELVGNFTTADEFTASVDQPSIPATGCPGGARIYLEPKDPAVIRMMYTRSGVYDPTAAKAALVAAFSPVFNIGTDKAPRFGIRVSDSSVSHFQYATICPAAGSIGILPGAAPPLGLGVDIPRPYIDTAHPLMTLDLGTGGVTPGQGAASNVVVNPVQAVRWEITQRSQYGDATTKARGKLLETPGVEALENARFELVRTWVPFDVPPFGPVAAACPDCVELIGEFPVDLKFGITTLVTGVMTTYPFNDPNLATIAPATATTGDPQHIRSIFFKLGTRTAMSDREFNIGGANPGFIFRYKINGTEFARVRETMEEVFVQNQTGMNYP